MRGFRDNRPTEPPEFEPVYPELHSLVTRADGTQGIVVGVWTPDDAEVPDWADEDDDKDVLVAFEDQLCGCELSTLSPIDGPIVQFNADHAHYIGDEYDGCYFQVRGFAGVWFVTVVVDSDTGGFVDTMIADDGPYYSEDAAALAGQAAAQDWCMTNEPTFDTFREALKLPKSGPT